jgi:hypothetical protein
MTLEWLRSAGTYVGTYAIHNAKHPVIDLGARVLFLPADMETLSEAAHLQQSSRHPRRVHIPWKSFDYLRHILAFGTEWSFLKY